jgi:hypothetical protein
MRALILCQAVLVMLGCVSGGCGGRHIRGDFPADGETGDHVIEEYEIIEDLRENPIDLRTADVEDLVSIPGFPRELALRVIEERGKRRSAAGWLSSMTPPERESLYGFEDFLVLPERKRLRFSARAKKEGLASQVPGRNDFYCSLIGDRRRLNVRLRTYREDRTAAVYCSSRAMSGHLRLHGGDYQPDFSMGLLLSGHDSSYPFSGGYPLRSSRRIIGRTSFYGETLRGGALEIWADRTSVILFAGKRRLYKSNLFRFEDDIVRGARLEIEAGERSAGATVICDPGATGDCLAAVDGRIVTRKLRLGAELAWNGSRRCAFAWGFSSGGDRSRIGAVLYSIPYGFGNRFGCVCGNRCRTDSMLKGCSVVLERRLPLRVACRAALENTMSENGFESKRKLTTRGEIERRGARATFKVSWTSRITDRTTYIPFPGSEPPETTESQSLHALLTWRPARGVLIRQSVRCPYSRAHAGYVASPTIRLAAFSGAVRCAVCCSVYRSLRGTPLFYLYEPVLRGGYPWRTLRGDGWRMVIRLESRFRTLRLSSLLSSDGGRGVEAAVQLAVDL